MRNDLFYKQIKENALNKPVIAIFEKYANTHADFQMYIITAPLGEKYEYQYEDRALIVLVPSHKLLFINLSDEEESFLDYVEDVIQDLIQCQISISIRILLDVLENGKMK